MLRLTLLALMALPLAAPTASPPLDAYGASANPTGSPIGGGPGYQHLVTDGVRVSSVRQLQRALSRARPGSVVYVDDRAALDLTHVGTVRIPRGVTLASGRGAAGSPGALLYTQDPDAQPMLLADGPNVRITGLRLRGPETRRRHEELGEMLARTGRIRASAARGVMTRQDGLEVDNCELWGWSHAAIYVYGPPRRVVRDVHIHHNDIHHNQRRGLGYGVAFRMGEGVVEANRFDWNRHSIAATGDPGTGYEARYNDVGPNASSHAFDMHGGHDRKDGTDIAGTRLSIHHNTFRATHVEAIRVRGRPQETARIEHNWFWHETPQASPRPLVQQYGEGRIAVGRNAYGRDQRVLAGGLLTRR